MTLVEVFRCRACSFEQGPFGTHGFDPKTGNGELMGSCPTCRRLSVSRVVAKVLQGRCGGCNGPLQGHDGRCPACGSRDCGFTPRIPGMP
jgi:hypothetical protein